MAGGAGGAQRGQRPKSPGGGPVGGQAPRFVPSCLSKFGEVPLEALAMEHK